MDQTQAKPIRVFYLWKYSDQTMDQWVRAGVEGVLDYNADSGSAAGVQNSFKISNVKFRPLNPEVDVFAVGVTAANDYYSPGFWATSITFTVKESGGIDSVQTSFEILAPTVATTLSVYDHLETPSGEIFRVESITPGSPNYTLVVERGAHATTKSAVLENAELELLTPRTGMERITLEGDTEALAAPVLDSAIGRGEGIDLAWHHTYTGEDLSRLHHWRVYYSTGAAVDPDASNTPDYETVSGEFWGYTFNPKSAGLPDIDTTYYFVVTAITKASKESVASNELSAKAYGSIMPNPTGPPTPDVSIEVNAAYRLKAEAKKPTGTNSALGVSNVKKATIEVYYADIGSGVPTDAAGTSHANQTLIGSYDDTSLPYSVELGVSANGFKDYWARAYFTDGEDEVSDWGLSTVFELNATTATTDTGVATGAAVTMLVDTGSFAKKTTYFANVTGSGNVDSASMCELAFRVDSVGTFAAGSDTPFTGATAIESVPKRYGGYPGIYHPSLPWDHTWEVTCRIYNNYGWSNWSTPVAITLLKSINTTDSDVCNMAEFGAWTIANPHPDGWSAAVPQPGPQQVTFTYKLPDANASSVWQIGIEGTEAASFPTETVAKSQATPGTAVAKPGGYEVDITIPGFAATLNLYAGKFLRLGSATLKNATDASLQVFIIASNTASAGVGEVFTLTLSGTAPVMNLNPAGAVTYWQIITKPIWDLCDYFQAIDVYPEQLGALRASKGVFYGNAVNMKFRAYAHNVWGKGARRESNTTAAGGGAGTATYKEIGGVGTGDIKDLAITEGLLGAGAVTAAKADPQILPIGHSIVFTATNYRSFSWAAGTVYFPDGDSDNIGGSSSGNLSTNTDYWVSYDPSSPGGGLTISTSVSTALAGGKIILAIVHTTSVTTEFCTIVSRWGAGVSIGASSIVAESVSAIFGTFGTMTAGTINGVTIQTSATASADGGIVLNATDMNIYTAAGNVIVKLDEDGLSSYNIGGSEITQLNATGLFIRPTNGSFGGIKLLPYNTTSAEMVFVDNLTTVANLRTSATAITLAMNTGLDFVITGLTSNIQLSAAGNLTLGGRYVSLIDGGATSYLIMRRAGDGATRYLSIAADDSLVVGSSAPA